MIKKSSYLLIIATVSFLAFTQTPAMAEDAASAPQQITIPDMPPTSPDADDMPLTMGPDMEEFDGLKGEDREKKFQEMRQKVKNMTPDERKAWQEKRKAWFDALPPEKKAALKEKMKRGRQMHMQRMMKNMPEECQAVVQKCMADHGEEMPKNSK